MDSREEMVMNRVWLGSIAIVLGIGGQAQCADLPVSPPPVVPVVAPIVNWSGFYIGGHGGFAWSRLRYSVGIPEGSCPPPDTTVLCEDFRFTPTSFIGGGQVGLQSQVDSWVFGVEGTWSGLDLQQTQQSILDPGSSRSIKINEIAAVEARFGFAGWNPVLFYAKAGYATARINVHLFEGPDGFVPDVNGHVTGWHGGWTLGAGIEYMPWQNVVFGVEFDFYNFAFDTKTPVLFSDGVNSFQIWGSNADVYSIRARLSYLFNWWAPGALVARY
jgi:outer membrane immunogenic protein